MSRYTTTENDLIITVGMDYACQFWVTDHRGIAFPMEKPAKMTVKDNLGQILFETNATTGNIEDEPPDPVYEAILDTSANAGMLQITIPRGMSGYWTPGIYSYDIWATILDTAAQVVTPGGGQQPIFPTGQQLPIAKGKFIVRQRMTVMEDF